MKNLSARTQTPGIGPVVLLDLEVKGLSATINMSTGVANVSIWDDEGTEHDITAAVTSEYPTYKVTCFEDIADLRELMEDWEPAEPDYEAMASDRDDYRQFSHDLLNHNTPTI
jgi:hypothetical protein